MYNNDVDCSRVAVSREARAHGSVPSGRPWQHLRRQPPCRGGGPAALDTLVDERLIERSAELGEYMLDQLRQLRSPMIRDIRGRGLWCGVDFDPERIAGRDVAVRLLAAGILTKETRDTVIRLAPPSASNAARSTGR
jgi:acetylornithine/succinyldiaminopimelate/putrescine aminotransferase